MFRNYLKTTFRNFKKYKLYTIINVCSLCIGITVSFLVYKYVSHEFSYDRFFRNAGQIYRLEHYSQLGGGLNNRYANINQYINPGYLNSIPGIVNQTRFALLPNVFVETDQKRIAEPDFWVADSSFFSTFSFPFINGNKETALSEPNNLVITKEIAQKYFETSDKALGKVVTVTFQNASVDVTVTGIVENVPSNSHLQFDGIASSSLYSGLFQRDLSEAYLGYNYLQLEEGRNPAEIETLFIENSKTTHPSAIDFRLQPLTDIHLYSSARGEISANSDIRYIYFFIAATVILLVIASINFTSLAAAQNLQRYKEAGIRKVLGANRGQLAGQYLFETVTLSLVVTAGAVLVIYLILPHFNNLTGIPFPLSDFINPGSVSLLLLVSIMVGVFAGFYPAVLLSAFQPVQTLKGIAPSGKKGASLWQTIVVAQFASTIAMIIFTAAIYRQLNFMQTKNLGFEKERIVTFYNTLGPEFAPLKSRLAGIPGVQSVSVSSYIPGVSRTGGTAMVQAPGIDDTLTFNWISVDFDYFDTYGIGIKQGRAFSENYGADSTQAFMLNEAAVKALGWESPLGREVTALAKMGTVIGVTDNFNFLSLHEEISPIIFLMDKSLYFNFSVRLSPTATISETVAQIQDTWQTLLPNIPFEYHFVDDQFDQLYKQEQRLGTLFGILTPLALFIACLGLFSLSSFMATKKRKEIGIRKVHGASLSDILISFYGKYGKLFVLAGIIAVPASVYFLTNWLQNFAFRISFPFDLFALGIAAALIITIITVSYESIRAALSNPVESLKSE